MVRRITAITRGSVCPTSRITADTFVLITRRLLRATTPREAVSAVSALVRQLGGTIVRPRHGDARVLDVDLSLGTGEPMAVAVEPYSVARLCLEEVLPAALSDARRPTPDARRVQTISAAVGFATIGGKPAVAELS